MGFLLSTGGQLPQPCFLPPFPILRFKNQEITSTTKFFALWPLSLSDKIRVAAKRLKKKDRLKVTASWIQNLEGKAMRDFCHRKQGVSRGLRPNLLVLNKGAITALSLFKPFSSNTDRSAS